MSASQAASQARADFTKTKIIATLGPSSATIEEIEALLLLGANVFRLNFSHGEKEEHAARMAAIRSLEVKHGVSIGVLLDLQGPKLRVGKFGGDGEVMLAQGDAFRLDLEDKPGDATRVQLPHPEILSAVTPGMNLLVNDGKVQLRVTGGGPSYVDTIVDVGGKVSNRKGVNVPDVVLPIPALTAKDREDAAYGLELGVDWMALSFVQRPEDIDELRAIVGARAAIMAKLEKASAVGEALDAVVARADGVMVARGDLGVEMAAAQVPILQRRIVQACRARGVPVVIATQMLESMVAQPVPTRAEASDVAAAIYSGVDAVMLSAESAVGGYPREALVMMKSVIQSVEGDESYYREDAPHKTVPSMVEGGGLTDHLGRPYATAAAVPRAPPERAMTIAARQVARSVGACAIAVYSRGGVSALRASQERSSRPILALSPRAETARRLSLVYGVLSVHSAELDPDDPSRSAEAAAELGELMAPHFDTVAPLITGAVAAEGLGTTGDLVVATMWTPDGAPNGANAMRIIRVS